MRLPHRWICALCLALPGLLLVAAAVLPPDVSYSSSTSVKVSGLVGDLLDKAGADKVSQDVFYSGNRMMTRNATSRTIVNLDAETITSVNDLTKTYTVTSFDDYAALFTSGAGEASPDDEPADYEANVRFWVDQPGVVDEVNGYRAERFRLHVVADVEATSDAQGDTDRGQFALAIELWVSDVEGYVTIKDFRERYAEQFGRALGGGSNLFDTIKKVLGDDPAIRQSLERSQEEIDKMDKMTVREIVHVVTVPRGLEYDPEKVFGQQKKKKKKGGLGGFAKKLAQQATGGDTDDGEKAQKTVLTATTDHEGFTITSIDQTIFDISDDYQQTDYYGSREK